MWTKTLILAGALALASAVSAQADTLARAAGATLLRGGPSTSNRILQHVPANSRVSVESCSNGWCQVQVNGEEGYIARSRLSFGDGGAVIVRRRPIVTETYDEPVYEDEEIGPAYIYPGYAAGPFLFGGFGGYYGGQNHGWRGGYHGNHGGWHGGNHGGFHGGPIMRHH